VKRGHTEAETCKLNGWVVGDVLEGDEGDGTERMVISAIGALRLLGHRVGEPSTECSWTLSRRDWRKVEEVKP